MALIFYIENLLIKPSENGEKRIQCCFVLSTKLKVFSSNKKIIDWNYSIFVIAPNKSRKLEHIIMKLREYMFLFELYFHAIARCNDIVERLPTNKNSGSIHE